MKPQAGVSCLQVNHKVSTSFTTHHFPFNW